ncbi:flagellar biosynthetic protein FliO [Cohnella abietis]|uniref:Flagellar protein n=1 Tax=Cohnella abietis TaxID=2507935 RepID=A0A3T1D8L1_9BACL|nr:flagellar biosynthetic protein FliO [Cohnella abietis]BBI34427.1 hypothetical protein KCTCHS21_38260 [Cohnella abietis]
MRTYGLVDELPVSGFASAWDLIKILFVLGLIVVLIVVTLRFLAKRNRGWGMNNSLRSLGGFPLGSNKSMQIVEWNNRIYVLGIGNDVTLLESITDPDIVAALLAEHDTMAANSGVALPEWLRKWASRNNPPTDDVPSKDAGGKVSFEQTLENRLRQVSERRQRVEQLLEDSRSGDGTDKP